MRQGGTQRNLHGTGFLPHNVRVKTSGTLEYYGHDFVRYRDLAISIIQRLWHMPVKTHYQQHAPFRPLVQPKRCMSCPHRSSIASGTFSCGRVLKSHHTVPYLGKGTPTIPYVRPLGGDTTQGVRLARRPKF